MSIRPVFIRASFRVKFHVIKRIDEVDETPTIFFCGKKASRSNGGADDGRL
jgi:hypothetical protein